MYVFFLGSSSLSKLPSWSLCACSAGLGCSSRRSLPCSSWFPLSSTVELACAELGLRMLTTGLFVVGFLKCPRVSSYPFVPPSHNVLFSRSRSLASLPLASGQVVPPVLSWSRMRCRTWMLLRCLVLEPDALPHM